MGLTEIQIHVYSWVKDAIRYIELPYKIKILRCSPVTLRHWHWQQDSNLYIGLFLHLYDGHESLTVAK